MVAASSSRSVSADGCGPTYEEQQRSGRTIVRHANRIGADVDVDDKQLHVMPVNDLIEHDDDEDCVCGPDSQSVERDDGSIGWIIVHHSLDGRERYE